MTVYFATLVHYLQNIIAPDLKEEVKELFVPRDQLEMVKAEAKTLPNLIINKLDLQWIQVSFSQNPSFQCSLCIVYLGIPIEAVYNTVVFHRS